VTYPSLPRRQLLSGFLSGSLAGEFREGMGHQYEALVHRLKLKGVIGI
jgi:hypothetical protein